jgi:hypothetical protein
MIHPSLFFMKRIVLFFLVFPFFGFCQQSGYISDLDEVYFKSNESIKYYKPNYKVKGSPYLNDEFKTSTVCFINGDTILSKLKYNVSNDKIHFLKNNQEYILSNYKNIRSINIGSDKFVPFFYENDFNGLYVEVGGIDNKNIYKKYSKKFYEKTGDRPISGSSPARYGSLQYKYYLIQIGEKPERIKLKKRYIFKVYKSVEDKLDSIVNKYDLNLKKEEDLKKMFEFFND